MKRTKTWVVFPTLLFLTLLIGCGTSRDPIAGGIDQSVAPAAVQQASHSVAGNRVLWGLWKISISADRQTVTVVPDRVGALHFNVVRLLEVTPCTDCLRITNLQVIPDGLSADVTLIHPFPGLLRYTGFDVRGIFISRADYTFQVSGRKIAWGDDVARMLNPDGYTHLFNPTNFPYTKPPILGYIPGHKAPGGDLSATLNPYVAYELDKPRCVFTPGTASTRTVELHFPPGPLEFGYAVDASWFPAGGEVTDPVNDFPSEANCMEAYRIDVEVGVGEEPSGGSAIPLQVEVFDHQGLDTISAVTIEAPGLFDGEVPLEFSEATGDDSFMFTGAVPYYQWTGSGVYPLLVRVVDTETDPNLGAVNAWQVSPVRKRGWARTWGGEYWAIGWGVTADGLGNVYITGYFGGTVDFDPGPGVDEHSWNGEGDAFLSKFDASGKFQWARTWGGEEWDQGYGVATDSMGNVYVTGFFHYIVDFDPGPGVDEHASNGGRDVFLSKFDSEGTFQWARTWGGESWDEGEGVATDSLGNVYLVGCFMGTVDFDPGPGSEEHSAHGATNVFLSKFDSSGEFHGARTWGGKGDITGYGDMAYGVTVDDLESVYVAGVFRGTVDFDPGPGIEERTAGWDWGGDRFLSKFNPAGEFQWVRAWDGDNDAEYESAGVAADAIGNVYVAGCFEGTVDFDPGPGIDEHGSNGYEDAVLSKFNSAGDFLWALTWGAATWEDYASAVSVDGLGNVYVTGEFGGTVDFDPGPGIEEHHSNGRHDVYLGKFSSSGEFQWVRTWGGTESEAGYGTAADSSGSVYVTGYFEDTVDFDPGPGVDEHTSNDYVDAFLSKFPPDGNW